MFKRIALLTTFLAAFTVVGFTMAPQAEAWRGGWGRPYGAYYYGPPPRAYYGAPYRAYYGGPVYGPRVYRSYYAPYYGPYGPYYGGRGVVVRF